MNEVETIVMGISISSGYGADSISVISATASLHNGCMPFAEALAVQTKMELVDRGIMKDLTKVCKTCHYPFTFKCIVCL